MPGCRDARLGLLDQDMFMKQPHNAAAHQIGCDLGSIGLEDEIPVFGNSRPVAVIAEETAFSRITLVDPGVGTRAFQIAFDSPSKQRDPIVELASDYCDAIGMEIRNCLFVNTCAQ